MGKVVLNRLDSRLAHGTVCSAWIPNLGIDNVIVIHDLYSKDAFIQKIFKKAIPKGCKIHTLCVDDAIKYWNEEQFGDGVTLVLVGDVKTAYEVYQKGYHFEELQVANISMIPGTKKVTVHKGVNMDKEEGDLLLDLQNSNGVNIYFQTFPPESRRPLDDVIKKAKWKK